MDERKQVIIKDLEDLISGIKSGDINIESLNIRAGITHYEDAGYGYLCAAHNGHDTITFKGYFPNRDDWAKLDKTNIREVSYE